MLTVAFGSSAVTESSRQSALPACFPRPPGSAQQSADGLQWEYEAVLGNAEDARIGRKLWPDCSWRVSLQDILVSDSTWPYKHVHGAAQKSGAEGQRCSHVGLRGARSSPRC